MSHFPSPTSSLWPALQSLDEAFVVAAAAAGCPDCGGRLHRADYPRQPRGGPSSGEVPGGFFRRFALCCSREGCRKRAPVPSARFQGRHVYLGIVVLLTVARRGAPPPRDTVAQLGAALGASRRTIERWCHKWSHCVPGSAWWREQSGRLRASSGSPAWRCVDSFGAESDVENQGRLMRFVAPYQD